MAKDTKDVKKIMEGYMWMFEENKGKQEMV